MKFNKNNTLLITGLAFILCGILLLVHVSVRVLSVVYIFRFLFLSVPGTVMLYFALTGTKRAFFVFTGLFLCCTSLLLLITDARLIPYTLHQIWPAAVVLSGLLLFPSGYIRFRKLQAFYIVPGIMLTGLGLLFLCFSLDIIKQSFAEFASHWWPLIFIMFGLGLIILFAYTQSRKSPVLSEDSDEDEDEDI
ncbi:DUF5668 domain-containing protein [Treponema sp. HNW]|uniref:LiaI-LiaF-like domain-containing protein n=1 Tax=Treponema sp. HNW TaxID=3116654 RepID=UPI003D0EE7D6